MNSVGAEILQRVARVLRILLLVPVALLTFPLGRHRRCLFHRANTSLRVPRSARVVCVSSLRFALFAWFT
jgi:hypothetical protein